MKWNHEKYSVIQRKAEKKEKGTQIRTEKLKARTKVMEFNLATSVITLNVKALIISVKRQRLSSLIRKPGAAAGRLQETHFQ